MGLSQESLAYIVELYGGEPDSEATFETLSQAESLAFEDQNVEVNVRSSRDLRGQLHAIRVDVAKSYGMVFAKVNALVRQGDDEALDSLSRVADRMRILADDIDVPVEGDRNCKKQNLRARLRKQMRKMSHSMEDLHIDPEEVLFCSLCFEEDPALPEDMDPDEPDARETQWMRCTQCRLWVHAVCARGIPQRNCQACKTGKYSIYV